MKNNPTFTSKANLTTNNVLGVEHYKPGDPTTKLMAIKTTSGTSGAGISVFLSNLNDLAVEYAHLPLLESPYVSIGMAPSNACLETNRLFHMSPVREIISLGPAEIRLPNIGELMREIHPRSLYGSPVSLLRSFLATLDAQGALESLADVHTLGVSGEALPVREQKEIRKYLPNLQRLIDEYGHAETNNSGLGCDALYARYPEADFTVVHPIPSYEMWIKDPDPDGVGEIVVSTPDLPNYLTGDAGKIVEEPCACGATKTLHLFGRLNFDRFFCAGAVFHVAELDQIMKPFLENFIAYRLEVTEHDDGVSKHGKAHLRLVPSPKMQNIKNPEFFFGNLVTRDLRVAPQKTLGDLIRFGSFDPLTVTLESERFPETKSVRLRKILWPPKRA